jgi:CHAT domain-containing protein
MAALYDGERYLVEKYAVSLALGLEVRDPEPSCVNSRAEALRRTQVAFLKDQNKYQYPRFWAPYVLVGSWL